MNMLCPPKMLRNFASPKMLRDLPNGGLQNVFDVILHLEAEWP